MIYVERGRLLDCVRGEVYAESDLICTIINMKGYSLHNVFVPDI